MAITINTNVASLQTQKRLAEGTSALKQAFERLSSGLRINRASDDPAGLAISSNLNADARVYAQGIRNINDGLSILNVADGAVNNLTEIINRQRELATQAANGVYSTKQRAALNSEFQALAKEYNRIVNSVSFNDVKLLDQSFGSSAIQAGYSSIQFSLGAGLATAVGDGTFKSAVSFGNGLVSTSTVAVGDLNGDGIPDVATSGQGTSISVRLANADGTFKANSLYTRGSGSNTNNLVIGDLNGDGALDLITANTYDNSVSVLLGNGDGTFKADRTTVLGVNLNSVTLVDLGSDGRMDLLASDSVNNKITLLHGMGNGSFSIGRSYSAGVGVYEAVYQDFNSDNVPDIMAAESLPETLLLIGKSDGTFGAALSVPITGPSNFRVVTAGDFNGDGNLDFATIGPSSVLATRLGNGDGTFRSPITYTIYSPEFVQEIQSVDLNGDGNLDILTTASPGAVNVMLGVGDGTFKSAVSFATSGNLTRDAVAVDMDLDGALDIVATSGASNNFGILYSNTRVVSNQTTMKITSMTDAKSAMITLSQAQQKVAAETANIGAVQSRFAAAVSTLATTRENYLQAVSSIVDADVAFETAELVRKRMVQQAASAVLAQANQEPAIALQLLKGR